MGKCSHCKNEMQKAKTCTFSHIIDDKKKSYERIVYGQGQEIDYIEEINENCRCGDCGIRINGYHHYGCDMETCPKCANQLLSCDCKFTTLGRK